MSISIKGQVSECDDLLKKSDLSGLGNMGKRLEVGMKTKLA